MQTLCVAAKEVVRLEVRRQLAIRSLLIGPLRHICLVLCLLRQQLLYLSDLTFDNWTKGVLHGALCVSCVAKVQLTFFKGWFALRELYVSSCWFPDH